MQPHHQTGAFIVVVGVAADVGDFVRRRAQRFQHQPARQFGFRVQRVNDVLRVFRYLLQRFRSVKMLAANHKPHFIVIKMVIIVSLMGQGCRSVRGAFGRGGDREIVKFGAFAHCW